MLVRVELFLHLRRFGPRGAGPHEVELPEGATVADLLERLGIPTHVRSIALVDGRLRPGGEALREGETVTVFPPLEGG